MLYGMSYEFVIHRSKDSQYYFTYRNVQGNTEPICWSEQYTTRQSCLDAINKVKQGASGAAVKDA